MIMWILKQNGEIVSRTTLRTLTNSELASDTEETKRYIFNKAANKKIGPTLYDIGINSELGDFFDDRYTPSFNPYVDNEGIKEPTMPEADAIADYCRYIESEVRLPRNGRRRVQQIETHRV